MGLVDVGLGNGEVDFHGVKIGVAEGALEGVDISPIAEVGNGKGMAESVGVAIGYAGAFSQAGEHAVEAGALHVVASGGAGEEGGVGRIVGTGGEIFPEGLASAG